MHSAFSFHTLGVLSLAACGHDHGVIVPQARPSAVLSTWENMWQTFDFTCQHFMKNKSDLTLIGFMFFKITKLVP